jgi:O-methyltransferase StaMB
MTQIDVPVPVPEEVGQHYDKYAALADATVGQNLHFGYWDTPDSTASFDEAAVRLTELLVSRLPVGPGQRVLDLGCGHGGPALAVARGTGANVTGISISAEQVKVATANAAAEGLADQVSFQHANALALPFEPASFDAVLAFESLIHMPDREHVLREVFTVLKPGGRLVLTDFYERAPIPANELAAVERYLRDMKFTIVQPGDYIPMLGRAGLWFVELTDITPQTMRPTFEHMSAKVTGDHRENLGGEYGEDLVDQLNNADLADVEEFGHLIVVAERPTV